MSSEVVTKEDLKKILNKILPSTAVDYIVEEGTSGIWTYRKWNSGKVELWGHTTGSVPSGWSSVGVVVQFPFTLTAYDSWSVSQGNWQISRCYLNISNTQIAIQTQSDEALTALFAFRVEGRWK